MSMTIIILSALLFLVYLAGGVFAIYVVRMLHFGLDHRYRPSVGLYAGMATTAGRRNIAIFLLLFWPILSFGIIRDWRSILSDVKKLDQFDQIKRAKNRATK